MRILVLGGSVFLSRAVVECALARGHDVVAANRGESGSVPDGAAVVPWDRDDPVPAELAAAPFDAVVDVGRLPSWARTAVAAWPSAHWIFVSTVNVYADDATPGGRPGTSDLVEPITVDVDPVEDPRAYGAMKVACEQIVREGTDSSTIVRPGLIVGPGDPTGRFSYWPRRLAGGGDVLAGGLPSDVVQVVDVRDLAAWIVTCAERRVVGDVDGVGEVMPIEAMLTGIADGLDRSADLTWVPQQFLVDAGVQPWSGDDSLPLWLPRPDYDGMVSRDPRPAIEAGLELRPIADTARATLAWLEQTPDAVVTGMSREREASVLESWRRR